MKHTEEQMLIKAKKILKDLNPQYFKDDHLLGVSYKESDEISRPRGKIMNTWVAVIEEPVFKSSEFLIISDETGEPLYIQGKHSIYEISKDDKGNYY